MEDRSKTMNLYVNAWQAMPAGGEIYLETKNVRLDDEQAILYSVRPGKNVKISVTDTGTGMDEKTRERIFDPFFTTKGMGRGTSLGLATVYGIIKGHKGAINVYSISGKAKHILDRGCNGFIQKPFHLEKLSWKVREMLD